MSRKAVCTICSNNYLHFARTLMDSVRAVEPDWDPYLLLCDENDGVFDASNEPFHVVELSELPIPNRRAFCFRYTILELNTAVKPWLLEWLFAKGYDQVVYLDPDIYVYRPMREVEEALEAGNFLVLTPHLTGRLDDHAKPSEHDILKAGAFNLGFAALRRHPTLLPFLRWWQEKVEFDCIIDFENAFFVDQKWIDLAPGMFGDVAVLRHEGYNVAYWNLKHRKVTKRRGGFFVNGQPLVFFHFSGLDPVLPGPLSKHQTRFRLSTLGRAKQLVKSYCETVIGNGLETCRTWPYAWDRFTDGTPILHYMRHHYRRHIEPEGTEKADPFTFGHDYFHQPWGNADPGGPLVTRLMHAVWECHRYLREDFPKIEGSSRGDYAYWFAEKVAGDLGIPECCVRLVRRSLERGDAAPGRPTARARVVGGSMPHVSPLGRLARRILPRRTKHWLKQFLTDDADIAPRDRHVVARAVVRLLRPLRRRLLPAAARAGAAAPVRRWEPHTPRPLLAGAGYTGFFDPEESFEGTWLSWMGPTAGVRVLKPRAGTLRITGEHSPGYLRRAGGTATTLLRVALDDMPVGVLRLQREGPFEKRLKLPQPASSRSVTLSLEASQHFVPAEIGLGEDRRELSVRIARITLDDTVLVDFSRRDGVFTPQVEDVQPGLNIVGYLRSELGVGESARLCVRAAEAAGIPYSLVDFTDWCPSRAEDHRLAHAITGENPYRVNLFHINADQMPLAFSHLGRGFFEGHYNIGMWHWELPEFPDDWLDSFALLDEIWAPSQFVRNTLSEKSPVPVVRMGHAVDFPVPTNLSRRDMNLPEEKFLFLMMYDMRSFQSRKNPEGVLEAFLKAFPEPKDAALVIKVMNSEVYPDEWAKLERRLARTPGVIVINRMLTRPEVYTLEALCDCFISLHRSEGFGLGLAESMFLGKPVIGTHWSGNVDFMNEHNSCPVGYRLVKLTRDHGPYRRGQYWAEPDIEQAAGYMRKLVTDPAFRTGIAQAGQKTLRTEFSPKAIGDQYRRRLQVIWKRTPARSPTTPPSPSQARLPRTRRLARRADCTGFHDPEEFEGGRRLSWMGAAATLHIPRPEAGTLRISGEYCPEFHRKAAGKRTALLHVSLDGEPVGKLTLRRAGPFDRRLKLAEPTSPKDATLALEASQTFVPAQVGLSEDRRELSVMISRIELNGRTLLDFARRPGAFTGRADVPQGELGLNVVGYLRSELGVGESARLCALSAEAAGVPHSLVNVTVGCTSRADDDRLADRISQENPHAVNLFHVNPEQMPLVLSHLGGHFVENRYNIGYWAWELPEFPDEWVDRFALVDEVWVPSRFVADAVSAKSPVLVVRMPHGIGLSASAGAARRSLGLPEGKFLFLTMYDMHSLQGRKNPEAALDAFRRAFPDPRDVTLVIKTMNTKTYPDEWRRLRRRVADRPGILTIGETLSRQEVYDLESLCDCFVSLHRSEGFGLGLAECMYLGKPVIGTHWSGNVDFMNVRNSCPVDFELVELDRDHGPYRKGQHWAEPDRDHAAHFMRKLVEDADYRRRIAAAGQETIRTEFSQEAVGRRYRRRLDVIARLL